MITLTQAATSTTAGPAGYFERWADMATWPEWNPDTEWVRLDGPFVAGATGVMKPKGGPKVRFVVDRLSSTEFVDRSTLFGAALVFDHQVRSVEGRTDVSVIVTLSGPLARFWNLVLGKGIRDSTQRDLDELTRRVEAADRARK
jgi:hypothetical protein